jgi:hypothetical protein
MDNEYRHMLLMKNMKIHLIQSTKLHVLLTDNRRYVGENVICMGLSSKTHFLLFIAAYSGQWLRTLDDLPPPLRIVVPVSICGPQLILRSEGHTTR